MGATPQPTRRPAAMRLPVAQSTLSQISEFVLASNKLG